MAGCGVGPLLHHRQLRHTQRQPLGAVAGEVDLGARIVARAFNGQHLAFAKLGVEHRDACAQAVRRRGFLRGNWGTGKGFRLEAKLASGA